MRQYLRHFFLALLLPLAFVACSSSDTKETEPAELVDIEQTVKLKKAWSRSVGNGQSKRYFRLTPAVAGDKVYAAAENGKVVALNLDGGKIVWKQSLDQSVSGGVGVGCGLVLLGTDKGRVTALQQDTGELLWEASVDGEVLAAPQCDGGVVAAQTFDGKVVGLAAETGEKRWAYTSSLPVLTLRGTSTPLFFDDIVVVAFANGKIMGLAADNGSVRWESRAVFAQGSSEIERLVDIDAPMLLDGRTLYAVSYQGNLVAIDPNNGRRFWLRETSSTAGIASGFSHLYVVTADGKVQAFSETGQGLVWEQGAMLRRQLSGPQTLGSYVAVADFEGYIHLMSQVDGNFVGRVRIDSSGVRVQPVVADDTLIVFSNDGKLTAYRLP